MTITTNTVVDEITISLNGCVSIRQNTTILDGSNVIGNTFQRTLLTPGSDVSTQPSNVDAVCNATWTPEIISAYQAQVDADAKALTTQTTGL